ncbi:glutamate--cysteine ligase [Shewanella sp. 10N.7]|uniref:glutamate--cysteine ligase n=1 Tax=Shewanella sp. 10N.7 TaxID=2885093 RepID=UPI001E595E8B|nr:glutamate--cysteine ligase [Shewanella sp. 10N.7]MCC4833214.1 glutamate--cysteine ligase [Shewanella sp. 10N.7]
MNSFNETIDLLSNGEGRESLLGMLRGIEREALRIDDSGQLAKDGHPEKLGSALTHSRITTDYSESLLEFITPVNTNIDTLLEGLTQTHAYSVKNMNGQSLWPVSMPCYVGDEKDIPIARYGCSNNGKMKTLYRKGLTHRYGPLMQIIAGVHFNFSVSEKLWDSLYENSDKSLTRQDFISESYFGMIRNYRRLVWVLPYFFGSSPALCSSFIKGQSTEFDFKTTGKGTLYLPYATSLRMSDLGYTNQEQEQLNISYNSLPEYLNGVGEAIRMPSESFAKIGVKVDGEYRQLNSNVLQIENEFYSPIRAKRVAKSGEKPSEALARAGVEYIEVRALDVNPYSPIGIDASQVKFLDLFLLYCLLLSSEKTDASAEAEIAANLKAVVLEGRKPGLALSRNGQQVALNEWLNDIFEPMTRIAKLLDGEGTQYQDALTQWHATINDPSKTISGRVIDDVVNQGIDHGVWVKQLSQQYHEYLSNYPLSESTMAEYEAEAAASLQQQKDVETQPSVGFDEFLADYFADLAEPATAVNQ